MNERREFSTLDIVKLLGIPRERLRVWIDKGYITPSIQKSEKQGDKNIFNLIDLYAIELFKQLIEDSGMNREAASKWVKRWQELSNESYEKHFDKNKAISSIFNLCNVFAFLKYEDGGKESMFILSTKGNKFINFEDRFSHVGKEIGGCMDISADTYKTWTSVTIMNFQKLREKVDSSLKNLPS